MVPLCSATRPVASALAHAVAVASTLLLTACGSGPTEGPKTADQPIPVGGVRGDAGVQMASTSPGGNGGGGRSRGTPAIAEPKGRPADPEDAPAGPVAEAGPDPMRGSFTLAQATAGLPPAGPLMATIRTSKGDLRCKLFDDKAPIAVANFVGLARGTRPFKDNEKWVMRNAYDGTTFHRVIKGFMIQGGDPQGTGRGEPGYVFKDELWSGNGSKHDRPGLLCMANRGPDTNGMQFFITDASAPHLDRSYTIFGECSPVSVVHAIANVPTEVADRPVQEVRIDKVEITRNGVGGAAPPQAAAPAPGQPPAQAPAPAQAAGTAPAPPGSASDAAGGGAKDPKNSAR